MKKDLDNIEKEFWGNHLPLFETFFHGRIFAQIKAVELLIEGVEGFTNVNMPDKYFNKLIDSFDQLQPILHLHEDSELLKLIEQLPGLLSIPVENQHRTSNSNDSLIVKASKMFKRIRFFLGDKDQVRSFEYRYLVGRAYIEHQYLCLLWQKTLLGMVTNFLVQSKVLALKIYSNNADKDALSELILSNKLLLRDFKIKAESQIKTNIQSLSNRVVNELKIAGTIELSDHSYSKETFARKLSAFNGDLKESARVWGDLISINIEQLKAASTLIKLNQQLGTYEQNLQERFEVYISKTIEEPFKQLVSFLETNFESLNNSNSITKTKLEKVCEDVTKTTEVIVNEKLIAPLNITCDDKILSKKLDSFASDVAVLANRVEEKVTLVEDLSYNEQLPEYQTKPIQWQSLFRRILGDEYLSELLSEDIEPENQLQLIVEDFSEVHQIISTNLAIAQDVEKSEEEAPFEIVKKGIELALIKLSEIEQDYPRIEYDLNKELIEHQNDLTDRISKLLIDQDAGQIKREDAKIKARQSASDVRKKLGVIWAKFTDKLELARRFVFTKVASINHLIRTFLGLVESEHINVQKTNIAALLHEIDLKYRKLPYIYRRLFDYKRLADASFFVRHQPHFETVSKAYDLWKSDFPSSIAILGEKGSGRSTELNYLRHEIFVDDRVEVINFDKTIFTESDLVAEISRQLKVTAKKTTDEIIALLSRRRKKTVIIVENLQNCFLRTVKGYEAINALLYLIAETKENILWVCSCSKYGWNFLNVAVKISDYFSHSLIVDNQPDANISEIIMRRQIASGYQLEIIPDHSLKNSRAFKKIGDDEEAQEKFLLNVFFERLNKMAEGNVTVAMIYWIRCIEKIESAEVYVKLEETSGIEYLSELDSETLFVLTAFVLHDVLNAEQLGKCLNFSVKYSETIISRLTSRGLLVDSTRGYGLNDLIYRQLVRLLKSRNLINA